MVTNTKNLNTKHVLIITYNFPPQGGGSVIRVLKFCKYLTKYKWQPIILTTQKNNYSAYAPDLLKEISPKIKIFYTFLPFQKTSPVQKNTTQNKFKFLNQFKCIKTFILEKIIKQSAKHILPIDNKIVWLPFAILKGLFIIKKYHIRIIYSSSPPHSTHLIAYILSLLTHKKWVMEYRDDWTINNLYMQKTNLYQKFMATYFEKLFFKQAKKIILVTEESIKEYTKKYKNLLNKFEVITNGYDEADFKKKYNTDNSKKFKISYMGSIDERGNESNRTAIYFLRAIKCATLKNPDLEKFLKIIFIGQHPGLKKVVNKLNLSNVTKVYDYQKREKCIKLMLNSNVLLLVIFNKQGSKTAIPGKAYEYLRAQKPILALADRGATRNLILKTKSGFVAKPDNLNEIKGAILKLYSLWKNNKLQVHTNKYILKSYRREILTKNLVSIFNKIILENLKN